jgi:hypothetical protein
MSRGFLLGVCALMTILSAACEARAPGEWFGVSVAGHASRPKLTEVHLKSSEPGVNPIDDGGSRFGYQHSNGLRVPERFDLSWRTAADTTLRHAVFRVREKLPPEVLKKIASGYKPTHSLELMFRVRDGQAECRWNLADISEESKRQREASGTDRMGASVVLEGVIAGEEVAAGS